MTDSASDLRKKLFSKGIGSALPPHGPRSLTNKSLLTGPRSATNAPKNFTPHDWREFFDEKFPVQVASSSCAANSKSNTNDNDIFNAYSKGDIFDGTKPVILMLHGGGFSALTWACFSKCLFEMIDCSILAFDSRGHGDTVTSDDYDLSAEIQADDVKHVIDQIYRARPIPRMFLIGHSMGGAIAVHVADRRLLPTLIGLAVIDVVEGSAMDALNSMQNFLRSRPASFASLEKAIEWCVRTGQIRNLESARISMPSQVIQCKAKVDVKNESFREEDEEASDEKNGLKGRNSVDESSTTAVTSNYVWRIDLSRTEPFWRGWFENLSQKFLQLRQVDAKLLILANVDRLDKDLTVGQMQGKFQMIVLPKVGHCVHEDSPERVAETVATFLMRYKFVQPKNQFKPVMPGC